MVLFSAGDRWGALRLEMRLVGVGVDGHVLNYSRHDVALGESLKNSLAVLDCGNLVVASVTPDGDQPEKSLAKTAWQPGKRCTINSRLESLTKLP